MNKVLLRDQNNNNFALLKILFVWFYDHINSLYVITYY